MRPACHARRPAIAFPLERPGATVTTRPVATEVASATPQVPGATSAEPNPAEAGAATRPTIRRIRRGRGFSYVRPDGTTAKESYGYDATGIAEGGVWGIERSEYEAFSSELRAQTSFDGAFNFLGGLYYQTTRLDFDQDAIFLGGLADSSVTDPSTRYVGLRKQSRTDGETVAVFGQAIWKFAPQWELTAGARLTDVPSSRNASRLDESSSSIALRMT